MPGEQVVTLGTFTGVADGTAVTDHMLQGSTLIVVGTFVGTWALQASHDGTNWANVYSEGGVQLSQTAPGAFPITGTFPRLRGRCTAFTSGTIEMRLVKPGVKNG